MFIGQIIASGGDGGLEKHVRELSTCLVQQGHRVLVIGDAAFVRTLPKSVEHVSLNMRLSRHNPWLLFQLWQCLQKYQFDVVHAQANKAASMLSWLKPLVNIPTIATLHNIKSQFKLFHRFSHVICVSHYLAKQVNHTNVSVIYNGIEALAPTSTKIDFHQRYQLLKNKPVICAVGRLVPAKGFDILLEAIDGLAVNLLIVGEGQERAALEKRIALLDKNTSAMLIGHHNNPAEIMRKADGLVISSRREGFSYVLNEALLCGVNVLSTDVPVANEVLAAPLVVPVNDAISLRNRLQTLLHTPSYWAALMQEAQRIAKHEMTIEQMTNKTVYVYQALINKKIG